MIVTRCEFCVYGEYVSENIMYCWTHHCYMPKNNFCPYGKLSETGLSNEEILDELERKLIKE